MRTEQSTKCLYHVSNWGWGWARKIDLSPPVIYYWPFQGGSSVVVHICSIYIYQVQCCMTLWPPDSSAVRIALCILFVLSKLALWPPDFNSCSPCFLWSLFHVLVYLFNIFLLIFNIFLFFVQENHFRPRGSGWARQIDLSPPVIHYWPFQGGEFWCGSLLPVFGVRVSVMFHLMFVHYTFSSVWVAEWPPFGK